VRFRTKNWSSTRSASGPPNSRHCRSYFPKTRVVCCVRDAPWIIDSIERLVRGNVFELSGVFGFEPGNMVYTRINRVATAGPGRHVIGTGDYSGQSDILFRRSSGAVDIWETRGTSVPPAIVSATQVRPGTCRRGSDDRPRARCGRRFGWSDMWRMGCPPKFISPASTSVRN
jgi:hypothetical protein